MKFIKNIDLKGKRGQRTKEKAGYFNPLFLVSTHFYAQFLYIKPIIFCSCNIIISNTIKNTNKKL